MNWLNGPREQTLEEYTQTVGRHRFLFSPSKFPSTNGFNCHSLPGLFPHSISVPIHADFSLPFDDFQQ